MRNKAMQRKLDKRTMNIQPGDKVQVWTEGGEWRDAVIIKSAGYVGRSGAGFDYCFDPLPLRDPESSVMPSQGGWAAPTMIRSRPAPAQDSKP